MSEATNLPVQHTGGLTSTGNTSDLLAVARQAEQIKDLGRTLIASGLLPDSVTKPETALAIMLKGQELDIGPMYALSNVTIISGKPGLSSELMSALVRRAGHEIRIIETTDERATVEGVRKSDPQHPVRITFTHEDAQRANLIKNGPWKQYPGTMLAHRAISKLCKLYFSECIMGGYTPEELGAEVNEEGEVIDMPEGRSPASEPERQIPKVSDKGPTEKHRYLLGQVDEVYEQIPEESRPPLDTVRSWAAKGEIDAAKALERVTALRDQAHADESGEPSYEVAEEMDESGEVEVVEEGDSDQGEQATEANADEDGDS